MPYWLNGASGTIRRFRQKEICGRGARLPAFASRKANTGCAGCVKESPMSHVLIDVIKAITFHNGLLRIDCIAARANNEDRSSGTPVTQAVQELGKKLREQLQRRRQGKPPTQGGLTSTVLAASPMSALGDRLSPVLYCGEIAALRTGNPIVWCLQRERAGTRVRPTCQRAASSSRATLPIPTGVD
jgi:hypothetical protein